MSEPTFTIDPIKPDIAANIVRLLLDDRRREDDTPLMITVKAFSGVWHLPQWERLSLTRGHYYNSHRDEELRQGVKMERRIADFFLELGEALHAWCDDEEQNRIKIADAEKEAEKKRKEKEKARRAKQKEKAKAAGKLDEDEEDDDTDYFDEEEAE